MTQPAERLAALEAKVRELAEKGERVLNRVRALEDKATAIETRLTNIRERRRSSVRSKLEALENRLDAIEDDTPPADPNPGAGQATP